MYSGFKEAPIDLFWGQAYIIRLRECLAENSGFDVQGCLGVRVYIESKACR